MGAGIAVVTGASRGIGRAIAVDLAARGWRVAALARDVEALAQLASESPADSVLPVFADVTNAPAMAGAFAAVDQWGVPDLVVANAGSLAGVGPTWDVDPDRWWRDVEVNLRGVQLTMHHALPAMIARGQGRLVVMSSGMGRAPSPWTSAYGASKAAVTHLASSVAAELAGTGVAVFAISPGMVRTDMTDWPAALLAHRPELADLPDSAYLSTEAVTHLVRDIATGRLDALAGRFVHVRDDREAMLAVAEGLS